MMSEYDVHTPSEHETGAAADSTDSADGAERDDVADSAYERFSRARLYTVVALVCAVLTIWFLFNNVFLSPVFGFAGAFCSWRGLKNGGNKPALLLLGLICLAPALLAGLFLLMLLPNLPDLSFSDVRYVNE